MLPPGAATLDPTTTSSKPSPLTSKWGLKLVSTAVLALVAGTWKIQVGLAPLRSTVPARPRIRQNTVLRAGRSAVGLALVPVTRSVSRMLVHARSRHSSTTAPSIPGGSAQRRVGRRCVTSPREIGASGLGASSATQRVPTVCCPAAHAHVPITHDHVVSQARSQAPQWETSVVVSTQVAPQRIVPTSQATGGVSMAGDVSTIDASSTEGMSTSGMSTTDASTAGGVSPSTRSDTAASDGARTTVALQPPMDALASIAPATTPRRHAPYRSIIDTLLPSWIDRGRLREPSIELSIRRMPHPPSPSPLARYPRRPPSVHHVASPPSSGSILPRTGRIRGPPPADQRPRRGVPSRDVR
jgi:hypothetical protein